MEMDQDWNRVEELFFHCEELSPEDRGPYLDKACGDNPALRRKVERLLEASGSVGDRFERVVQQAAADEADAAADELEAESRALERVGAFRLLEVLGEGGMGTVFLGERADGAFRQKVAVKVVKEGLVGPHIERRFRRERQILARLEHPAVARLLDGGTTATGQPYLVMEYVQGEAIDAYCDHHRLSIAARLGLFRKVCAGVQMAHSNLVVHRDLKPANILVTVEGEPKLLDFGISKLLEDDEPTEGTALTFLGQRVLTPEYASPEQIREEPITTAVDVYALGLLLHRLLTSDRPYLLPKTRGEELRKVICETPAERPSATVARLMAADSTTAEAIASARATEPGRLRRRLAGDLDHIVAKALRKEPGQRYGSVEQLAGDIERHLAGMPVEARRGGWRYRAGRFVGRYRVGVAAVSSGVLALAVGLVGQSHAAERANREAERANVEARASAEVASFLVELFGAADPTLTRDELTARELLDRGVERIRHELADQPLTQAHLMSAMGRVYHNRGLFAEAEPLFATALERRLEVLPAGHPEIATSHLDLADDQRVQGRSEEAMPHYEKAVAMRREHFGDDSLELAEALNNMALGLIRLAEYDRARDLLEKARGIRQGLLGDDSLVAQSLHNLTLIAMRLGDYQEAARTGRATLEIKSRVLPPDHPSIGRSQAMLAFALKELGEFDEAERLLLAALEIMRHAWDENHLDVLMAEGDLAYIHHLQGAGESAEARQREVLDLKREHLGGEHVEVALSLDFLGRQLRDRGDLAGAEENFRRSLDLYSRLHAAEHPTVAKARLQLGRLLVQRGNLAEAEPLLRSAMTSLRKTLPPSHPDVADSLLGVAELLLRESSPQAARPLAQEGLEILRLAFPADHPRVARAQAILEESSGPSSNSPDRGWID